MFIKVEGWFINTNNIQAIKFSTDAYGMACYMVYMGPNFWIQLSVEGGEILINKLKE